MTTERDAAIEAVEMPALNVAMRAFVEAGPNKHVHSAQLAAAILAYDQHRGKQEPVARTDEEHDALMDALEEQYKAHPEAAANLRRTVAARRRASPQPADVGALRAKVIEECKAVAYRVCAETRHVTLGDKIVQALDTLGDAS